MNALELDTDDKADRREDVIVSVEVNGTPVRIVCERWRKPLAQGHFMHDHSRRWFRRYWVETTVGVFTPEQAQAYAAALQACTERAVHLTALEGLQDA